MVDPQSAQTVRENLLYIRKTLEAAGQITAVPGWCLLAAGILSAAGVAFNAFVTGAPWSPGPYPHAGSGHLERCALRFRCHRFLRHVSKKPPNVRSHSASAVAQAALESLPGSLCGRPSHRTRRPIRQAGMAAGYLARMLWCGGRQWRAGVCRAGPLYGIELFAGGCRRGGIATGSGLGLAGLGIRLAAHRLWSVHRTEAQWLKNRKLRAQLQTNWIR